MIDLSFFYSAKMAVVFILMFSSATLEAQRNEKDSFFDLMTAISKHFGGEFNDAEKALELDLNGANLFLERLHTFAAREIIRKNKNGEFECIDDRKESKKTDFKMAIKTILGEDILNLLKVIPENLGKKAYALLSTVLDKKLKPNKKVEDLQSLLKEFSLNFSEKKLFNLLFSLAARLEALVHGKNINGTLKEKEENSKDKIQTFLAVPKCFQESELSIFDYWIEIIETKTKKSQNTIYGVAIYKEKYDKYKSVSSEEEAFKLSKENYEILRQLNDQKCSIYESSNLLREAFNRAYTTFNYGDEETNRRLAAQLGNQKHILGGKIPQIFVNLLNQIESVFFFNWKRNEHWNKNYKCEYSMFFQNISESLMKMMSNKGIDPKLQLHSEDKEIREKVQKDVEESCKKFDNKEAKIIFLNNVHYELAINFEFNQRKDVYDRVEDLLSDWVGGKSLINMHGIYPLSEELYLKKNASQMLDKIKYFTSEKTNQKTISIIDALIGKEFNLRSLFDQIKTLVEVTIPEEKSNVEKAKKEINIKQWEKDIEFLKNNPESIAEEKYQKVVAIICTIKQHGEKVKMLASKIKTTKIQKILNELFSTIQNNETKYFGPKFLEQMEEFCNQLKPKQIEMEENEIVSEKILLKDIQFEFDEIWNRLRGVWEGFEEYYLEIPLMKLKERARTLAKAFGKMLIDVKEHYAQ